MPKDKLTNYINTAKKWFSKEKNRYLAIGIFFFILQFFVFLGNYHAENYDVFFWFCNHTPLFFAFAFILGKKDLIKGLINVGFLAQFAWTIDFLGFLIFKLYIFKVTDYIFETPNGLWVLVPIGIHVFATNLALISTYKKKPNLITLFYSLIYIIFLFAGTLTYTLDTNNVNCVIQLCGATNLTFNGYTNFWPIIVFFFIAVPTQGIQYLMYKLHKSKK